MSKQPNYGLSDREASIHRTLTGLRNALRSIIFNNGDCSRLGEPSEELCDCPTCLAKSALAGEEGWRFEGYNPLRRKTMPRGAAMNDAWRHYFLQAAGQANGTSAPMDAIMSQILFGSESTSEVTARDWYVATTIVQWLATNVGQCVLFDAGYRYEEKK